jgi:hypothetical protein
VRRDSEVGRDARNLNLKSISGEINVSDCDCGSAVLRCCSSSSVSSSRPGTHVSSAGCVWLRWVIMENKKWKREERLLALSDAKRHPAGLWLAHAAIEIGSCVAYLSLIIPLSGASFQVERVDRSINFCLLCLGRAHSSAVRRPAVPAYSACDGLPFSSPGACHTHSSPSSEC